MDRHNQAPARAALLSWRDRGSRGAKVRRNCPRVEHLESRRLLATVVQYPVPSGTGAAPDGMTTGPHGSLWFTEFGSDEIGTINPSTHVISEFPLPTSNAEPFRITLGPDGNLWFTEFGASQIGMINPTTDQITEYPLPAANLQPYGITAGPNNTIWFTEWSGNQIGTIAIKTGKLTSIPVPTSDSVPEGITLGADGKIWFTESLGNNIGMVNTKDNNSITEFALPTPGAQPDGITMGPGGNVWFTEYSSDQIGMYDPSTSSFSQFKIPTSSPSDTEPTEIAAGPDGNLWFTQSGSNDVGRFHVATQAFTEIAPPTATSGPRGITAGSDGAIWFTEFDAGKIAAIAPSTHIVITTTPPSQPTAGTPFGLTVTVEFDTGDVDTAFQGSVTATAVGATSNSDGALDGTTSVMATNGVASFPGLSLNDAGTYAILVDASGLAPVSTGPVLVTGPTGSPPVTTPVAPIPIVASEHLIMAGKGKSQYVAGIVLSFTAPLDPATARDSANYSVTQAGRGGRARAVQAVRLRAVYKPAARTVRLIFAGKPRFIAGGQLLLNGSKPNGITSSAGVYLEGNMGDYSGADALYTIKADGRGVAPG